MGIFRQFPYTNFHEMNLDEIIKMVLELQKEWEDFVIDWGKEVSEQVNEWLEAHPEATTTVQDNSLTADKFTEELRLQTIKDYITPEMYGAVGDGVTNDYKAFLDCAVDAHLNDKTILVPNKTYYLDGDGYPVIELYSNVKCLGSVFVVGDTHFKMTKPVFAYVHDNVIDHVNGVFANFVINNTTVADAYKDKFFVLDTQFDYGTSIAPEAPNDETLQECIFSKGADTKIYFTDDVTAYLTDNATALQVSDMNEKGYSFNGAIIRQKTNNGYGICFMSISRNNMSISDIQIECNNALGEGSVFVAEYANNITFKDIISFSIQPANIWTYEISCYYCANVLISNYKGSNAWSSIATRGLKNYTLENSITNTFDCHWNAFGIFNCLNNYLYSSAHVGVGNGMFIVKNTKCSMINTRADYFQTWYGDIIIEDCDTESGLQVNIPDDVTSGYHTFFNTFKMPNIKMRNVNHTVRPLYVRIPTTGSSRITPYSWLSVENMSLENVSVPYTNVKYKGFLKSVPFSSGSRSIPGRIAQIILDDGASSLDTIDVSANFTSSYCAVRKVGVVTNLEFTGLNSNSYSGNATLFTIPSDKVPSHAPCYATALHGNTPIAVYVDGSGNVKTVQAISTTGSRLTINMNWINTSIGSM